MLFRDLHLPMKEHTFTVLTTAFCVLLLVNAVLIIHYHLTKSNKLLGMRRTKDFHGKGQPGYNFWPYHKDSSKSHQQEKK